MCLQARILRLIRLPSLNVITSLGVVRRSHLVAVKIKKIGVHVVNLLVMDYR